MAKPRKQKWYTFNNVTISIRATNAWEAYRVLCERIWGDNGMDSQMVTDTYHVEGHEDCPGDTEELWGRPGTH